MKEDKLEDTARALDVISHSDITAVEAQRLIAQTLSRRSPPDTRTVHKIYTVLRDWAWHAINERRRDPELRDWYKLIQRQSSFLQEHRPEEAERLRVLYELVYTSITASQTVRAADILGRSHVRKILEVLYEQSDGALGRFAINAELNIKDANLSRVLKLLLASGLIERTRLGRTAEFRLTNEGSEQATKLFGPKGGANAPVALDDGEEDVGSSGPIRRMHVSAGDAGKRRQVRLAMRTHRKPKSDREVVRAIGSAKRLSNSGALHERKN